MIWASAERLLKGVGISPPSRFVHLLGVQNLSLRPLTTSKNDKPQTLSKQKTKNDESEVIK